MGVSDPERRGATVRVLLLGAGPEDCEHVRSVLGAATSTSFEIDEAASSDAVSEPEAAGYDVALLDVSGAGLAEFALARKHLPQLPIVFLSDRDDETLALRASRLGAHGYLLKRELNPRIAVSTLATAIRSQRTMVQLGAARERERYLANHDQLTGLPNRLLFNDRLAQAVAAARRSGHKLGLLFADLDGFKQINDGLGHAVGDGLLRGIARQVASCLRQTDTPARIGGDEFAVLLTQLGSEIDAARVAEKILEAIRKPMLFTPRSGVSTASIGIATFPRDGVDPDDLMNRADIAMYHAKKHGGDRHEFYSDHMNEALAQRLELESGLRAALEEGRFELFYQPQFDVRHGKIVGAEALIRWRDPVAGLIPPGRFIPTAEETGLIVPIGEWVLRDACRQCAAWHAAGHRNLRISVNVAAQQFKNPSFASLVASVLADSRLAAHALELEITESSLLEDLDLTTRTLRQLKDLGLRLSIDDFGTGYSSLAYLKRLSIDVLKIDQSFVHSLAHDPNDATITSTIVKMAQGLGLSTIAEGVETREQLLLLGSYGCSRMQGYLFGEPVPAATFDQWLRDPPFRWATGSAAREPEAGAREGGGPAR